MHEVISVQELGLSGRSDEKILRTAMQRQAVLVTRDRDFGHLIFVKGLGSGVIYLRYLNRYMKIFENNVKGALLQIISLYATQNSYGVAEKTAKL